MADDATLRPLRVDTCDRPADVQFRTHTAAEMRDLLTALAGGPEAIARRRSVSDRKFQGEREYDARFNAYAGGRLCSQYDAAFRDAEVQHWKAKLDAVFAPAQVAEAA